MQVCDRMLLHGFLYIMSSKNVLLMHHAVHLQSHDDTSLWSWTRFVNISVSLVSCIFLQRQ